MVGIEAIGSYIPPGRISNFERAARFEIDPDFIEKKLGVRQVSVKAREEETSDLCVRAFEQLQRKCELSVEDIGACVVVTQNPDKNIPHASAIVHGKLGLPESCAAFDISLGCSGFVYGLSIVQSFMDANGIERGLLFTADPYSKVLDPDDRNTATLFGDAAAVTLLSRNPVYRTSMFSMGTIGKEWEQLACVDGKLVMNGRGVFNFAATYVPKDVRGLLERQNVDLSSVDLFIFHQGSRYIIDTIAKQLRLDRSRVPFDIYDYGNTVSSSIPLILEREMINPANKLVAISGFGVGLSWASTLLRRCGG